MATRSIDTGTDELLCEIDERVATITLNRPEARNALSDRLTPALRQMIKQCGEDESVGAVLITGAGTAFCAGGDVKGMGDGAPRTETPFEERVALPAGQYFVTDLIGCTVFTCAGEETKLSSPACSMLTPPSTDSS